MDLIPEAIAAFSGSLGLPTTVSNAILSTVGGCQSDDAEAIVACTEDQTLTTEAPLLLRTDPVRTNIVVLGAGLYDDGTMRPVLESRLRAALDLANNFPAAPIVVTGGVPQNGRTEADAMYDWLVANGIPGDRITKEGRSTSTIENARFTDEILDSRRSPAAVVVTSPGHLQRALVDFRKAVGGERPIQGVVAP
ncbi:YdcF family protein [Tomitella fengzijianii]|uniref:YdcF family protein n=1 Tax=Tomitella fengzijianii TaxID=2597660 RepID=A0A516X8S3_9ACTN|nr:YdcF family protein [Tomitella fengzijianii]